jgi:NhaP-type Na+/H+ or K+/H+ antiporter
LFKGSFSRSKIYTLQFSNSYKGKRKKQGCGRLVNFATIEKSFTVVFFVITGSAICLATILNMQGTALLLLLINFIVAGFVAIFGSLRSREEEEEKRSK